ncbi:L-serine dehydratase/L-threonine deaminase isoform X2 [Nematostella vectensis]|uniref:L-serine dehydratase/L-threonine deaminase isoform X2 n=1 Tax=Nematostella vectensis TaxID=45351 RepID=UPI0020775FF8|nr:L-serine dehydratase/L-threonine deaminase isoform X2 [Nematostella vectensis]
MHSLHVKTPLLESHPLSRKAKCSVYIKLDNVQPCGSFKIRGVGNLCQKAVQRGSQHLVCSSGGNAGLAAAYSARMLDTPCDIIVPSTTPESMVVRLREEGANVTVHGDVWDEADGYARKLVQEKGYTYVPPFNHPDIWEGVASVIHESSEQIKNKPDVVVVCVGGGGLLCGVLQGLHDVGWKDVPVIAMETEGANSFEASVKAGELVTLDGIRSIAKTLGATRVAERALEWTKEHNVISCVCTDSQAVNACERFANDHRMLVEPSCGATLAAIYENILPKLQVDGRLGTIKTALVIVCGGNMVTIEQLLKWKTQLRLNEVNQKVL